jgi:hypothetical protein
MRQRTRYLLPALLVGLVGAGPAAAERPSGGVLEGARGGTVLFDDDGGKVQIVPLAPGAAHEATFHGGRVLAHARVRVLFVGSGWRERRGLEAKATATVESIARSAGERADATGIAIAEDLVDPTSGRMSDLEVQRRLERMWGSSSEAEAVTVLFLAPGMTTSLGDAISGRDFAAYHNFLHVEAGVLVYAVVPFAEEATRWEGVARRCVSEALANPEGDGWY